MRPSVTTCAMRRKGYALVVTLVMLALLGVVVGQLASRSADRAIMANTAEDAMRQRWAELTCQRTLLGGAPGRTDARFASWLASLEEDAGLGDALAPKPLPVESLKLELRGVTVWLRIEDEQAKINLNERLRADPDAAMAPDQVIGDLLLSARGADLRFTRPAFVRALGLKPLESWAQVLPGRSAPALLGIRHPDQLQSAPTDDAVTRRLTLWGSGQLNFARAEEDVLQQRLAGHVQTGTIDRVLLLRREHPALGLLALIDNATAEHAEDRAALRAALTDRSTCYAMWMASRSTRRTDAATRWSLCILEQTSNTPDGGDAALRHVRW